MGGLDLVKHPRSDPKTARIPILMVTTKSLTEDILQARAAPPDGVHPDATMREAAGRQAMIDETIRSRRSSASRSS
jgi:CheY-like chemotaxis protein